MVSSRAIYIRWHCPAFDHNSLFSHSDKNTDILPSRIFSTEVGVRPAEPCSVSVVATHQLLTNIFEHICITIISNPHFRHESGSIITGRDLQTLERCNRDNINALKSIVNRDMDGPELELREAGRSTTAVIHIVKTVSICDIRTDFFNQGDLWAEHILENAKAYIMSFIYIVVTVTLGMPLISGIAYSAGLRNDESILYFTRFLDALIYFWLPQINILIVSAAISKVYWIRLLTPGVHLVLLLSCALSKDAT